MKKLNPYDNTPNRQEVWEHHDRIYSIVDLTILPWDDDTPPPAAALASWARLTAYMYRTYPIEVADMTDGIEVIGRYETFADARRAIKIGQVLKLSEDE